ncbi:MAG TPA: sigma-70 family RNA polymerase sigma factor, partial [Pilimelia sp.]|nr:sigma-70 family RNA polymerase sigma factor [Pilimelia sp.]
DDDLVDEQSTPVDQEVLAHERGAVLRQAFAELPQRCQRLLSLLIEDPPVPYAEIGARLGMPVGSIGPNRARCLERMRQCPVLAALIAVDTAHGEGGERHGQPVVER